MCNDEWSRRVDAVREKLGTLTLTDINPTFDEFGAFLSFYEIGRGHSSVGKEHAIETMEKMLLRC